MAQGHEVVERVGDDGIIDPNGLDLFRLTMMVITASICGGICGGIFSLAVRTPAPSSSRGPSVSLACSRS